MDTLEKVKNYYGKVLGSSKDLKTSACCSTESLPAIARPLMKNIHDEILDKFYGCGAPLPLALKGQTVLDLGCGTGRDCYLLSQLVGEDGKVIGVDMTDEQLAVAKKHLDFQMDKFGYKTANVEFRQGYIEDLKSAAIADESVDVVVSNCVTNLSPDKSKVFSEIFRVLKKGGELYFSDVFADRRIPKHLAEDPVLLGECLGGAMYIEDFRRLLISLGVPDFRIISQSKIEVVDDYVKSKIGHVGFSSITFRAFKLDDLEDKCEDFGQVAYYLGTIESAETEFHLDDHHAFKPHVPFLVCGNSASMLSNTRFGKHFKILGTKEHHLGLFDCAPVVAATTSTAGANSAGACC